LIKAPRLTWFLSQDLRFAEAKSEERPSEYA
jgi:hypothetical protein